MATGNIRKRLGVGLAFPASVVVLLIIIVPIFMLFRYSFNQYDPMDMMVDAFTFENYAKFFSDPYYRGVIWQTLWISALCTVLALVLGFPVAYMLAKTQSRHKSLLIILLVFPLMVGNVVRSVGWRFVLDNDGVLSALLKFLGVVDPQSTINLLYTPAAVIIGTTAIIMPYLILVLQSVLEGIDFSVEEAAQNLGASFGTTFRRIILPIAAPGIAAGTMLVFILCMNAYATPKLLGGTGVTMMAPTIYDQIAKASNWPFGASVALILVCATLIIALCSNWLIHRRYVKTMVA